MIVRACDEHDNIAARISPHREVLDLRRSTHLERPPVALVLTDANLVEILVTAEAERLRQAFAVQHARDGRLGGERRGGRVALHELRADQIARGLRRCFVARSNMRPPLRTGAGDAMKDCRKFKSTSSGISGPLRAGAGPRTQGCAPSRHDRARHRPATSSMSRGLCQWCPARWIWAKPKQSQIFGQLSSLVII